MKSLVSRVKKKRKRTLKNGSCTLGIKIENFRQYYFICYDNNNNKKLYLFNNQNEKNKYNSNYSNKSMKNVFDFKLLNSSLNPK